MKLPASCRLLMCQHSITFCFIFILSSLLLASHTSAQSATSVVKQTLVERPTFIPCELAQLALGPQGLKIPGVKYFPCTLVRSAKYISGHYKRGLRMLMKNHRKSLSRNKFLNSVGNKQKSKVMSTMATKMAGNVVARVASTFMKRRA